MLQGDGILFDPKGGGLQIELRRADLILLPLHLHLSSPLDAIVRRLLLPGVVLLCDCVLVDPGRGRALHHARGFQGCAVGVLIRLREARDQRAAPKLILEDGWLQFHPLRLGLLLDQLSLGYHWLAAKLGQLLLEREIGTPLVLKLGLEGKHRLLHASESLVLVAKQLSEVEYLPPEACL